MTIYDEDKIDCHNHIFDPVRFPYREDTVYRPSGQEIGTAAQFLRVMDANGVRHALLVGPTSGYRTDNRCMLDAIRHAGGRFKGIAVVDNDVTHAELLGLKDAGVVGVAFNPAMEGVEVVTGAKALLDMLADLDLFAQIQVVDDQLVRITPMLESVRTRILIDHCGRPDVAVGLNQPGFQALLRLADGGRTTVKLSGLQKFSQADHPYDDAQVFVRELVRTFGPDACVWGSDWPFLRASSRLDYGPLLELFASVVPDPAERRRILWDTPRKLFGFGSLAAR
ncbi:amidohydrolase family protein [Caballeronia insecticola]|uniref:Amidohydrolase 2 n=1 Tax=Caballeronia insecticola TaxID=758793 RepID=R4WY89_9BURK|nr:amidohydrolase family protein [Caballeronia insecticola]BAN26360.1 amidohydrolase 2 [Caballeronia insecticola]